MPKRTRLPVWRVRRLRWRLAAPAAADFTESSNSGFVSRHEAFV